MWAPNGKLLGVAGDAAVPWRVLLAFKLACKVYISIRIGVQICMWAPNGKLLGVAGDAAVPWQVLSDESEEFRIQIS